MDKQHDNKNRSFYISPRPRKRPGTPRLAVPASPPPTSKLGGGAASVPDEQPTKKVSKPYRVGYGKPPVEHQFQLGCRPGPGRPKGSKSQDTLLRAELEAKQPIRIGGRERQVPKRVLVAKLFVNGPLEKRDHKQLAVVHAEAKRLFPEPVVEPAARAAHDPAADQAILRQFLAGLTLGEPGEDAADPLADMALGGPDLGHGGDEDGWSEGDWDAPFEETSDEDD